jgi:hypothetical protein
MQAVMDVERRAGYDPHDVSAEKRDYDIESRISGTGRLRIIDAKGRIEGANSVTITKDEILTGLNRPADFILAIGLIDGASESVRPRYLHQPFTCEPDFNATSVNYQLAALLAQSEEPA